MQIFYKELTLQEGFCVLSKPREMRLVDGIRVSAPSGAALWHACNEHNIKIKCWCCGAEADRFIVRHHKNDQKKPPVLELFASTKHSLVMMTRDHIIPVSLGGNDSVENLRPACEPCNHRRKNKMNNKDKKFMDANPHLWSKPNE